jgi:P-type Ca2+ transporter type 2C
VCNNAVINGDCLLGQPTEGALLAAAMKHGIYAARDQYVRLQEYPFRFDVFVLYRLIVLIIHSKMCSSDTKMMAVRCSAKYGENMNKEVFFVKGAVEKILPQCSKYVSPEGQFVMLTKQKENEFLAEAYSIGRKGLRVVGMATGNSLQQLTYLGLAGICDPPRPSVRPALAALRHSGVCVKMVTGDAQETAIAIGSFFIILERRYFILPNFQPK